MNKNLMDHRLGQTVNGREWSVKENKMGFLDENDYGWNQYNNWKWTKVVITSFFWYKKI